MPISQEQNAPNFTPPKKPVPDTGNTASKTAYRPRSGVLGQGTTFNDKNQYKIEDLAYPANIMAEEYGYNNVVFYINVMADSKLLKDPANVTVSDLTPRETSALVGANITEGQAIGGSAAGGIGAAVAGGTAGGVSSYGTTNAAGNKTGVAGAVGSGVKTAGTVAAGAAAISAVGVEAVGLVTSNFSQQTRRLAAAIALHIPNQLSVRYGMNWGEEDTNTFMYGAAGGEQIGKAVQGASQTDQVKSTASSIAAAIALQKTPEAGALSRTTGLAVNPRKEQVFKSVDFRTFAFTYEFYPRDPDEAANVMRIIQMFKLHMHPEFKDSANFLYIYPSEFDIFYYQGSKENMNLHRHTSCVLTEMTVNYSPQGQFTTFENGMPTQININLNFKELALLTKEKIQDGF